MNFSIKQYFEEEEKEQCKEQIYALLSKEKNLSYRSKKEINNLLDKEQVILACKKDTNEIIGFIFREQVGNGCFEIGAWFCEPTWRKKGVGEKLFLSAIKDQKASYCLFTFQEKVVHFAEQYGFSKSTLKNMPASLSFHLVKKRLRCQRIKDILKHSQKNNPIFMYKQATPS